jgi:hypothetical protein
VFLVSGEISERERIFRRVHHSQVALHSRSQSHARFGGSLRDNRFHERMGNEEFRNVPGVLCRNQKIQIMYDFFSPPITSSQIDLQSAAMGR